ncbi:helix-turn-helix domain-containing protein [Clostridium perfringens]|uniref:helix-turn-helix domain-containing protein n=1 Tax=Clostridium perfringens TaxID=1502 RepID=UPI0018E42FDB|nr:helix-turn-helix domain-containing protein [Clostridium perfringens]MBI6078343.1 helix-turn-helix domain-containing protein [Clostridium perfringens]MBI6083980.1 helix-turn-helix domain-containing protein [Clostridium perfringens]MBI6099008.1 helix-turn-helix domain-containing protein [Clostridium perfringens]
MAKVSKDFIKFRQHIRTLNLSINEQYLLELFFEFHNHNYGYCYLQIKDILVAFNTTSKNRISTTIKSLEEKNLIIVDREHKNNRYFIVDINNFITVKEEIKKKINIDSNGNAPIDGQQTIEELIGGEDKRVTTIKQTVNDGIVSQELITVALENDIEIVKEACADVKEKTNKVNSKFLINAINYAKGRNKKNLNIRSEVNPRSFNNFEGRKYNYDTLEQMLLGYVEYDDNDIHDVLSGSNIAI